MISKKLIDVQKEFYEVGRKDEEFVMESTAKIFGGTCEKSSRNEDMYDHVDFWWHSPKKGRIGVDVKGVRRNTRKGELDDRIQWVELRNVRGDKGSLYGKAEYIAFRTFKDVIFVKRQKLLDFVLDKIKGKNTVYKCPWDFYIPYQRYGRLDLVVKIPTSDLYGLSDFLIDCTS